MFTKIKYYEQINNRLAELLKTKALLESVNTSACINQLLLARKERMTFGTNFNTNVLLSGTCVNDIAASACNGCILVCGMHLLLHGCHLFQIIPCSRFALKQCSRRVIDLPIYLITQRRKNQVFFEIFFIGITPRRQAALQGWRQVLRQWECSRSSRRCGISRRRPYRSSRCR